jgi:hypothetical protein
MAEFIRVRNPAGIDHPEITHGDRYDRNNKAVSVDGLAEMTKHKI